MEEWMVEAEEEDRRRAEEFQQVFFSLFLWKGEGESQNLVHFTLDRNLVFQS